MLIRLDKFLADAGQGTRSTVKALARQGMVKVNDVVVKKTDIKVDTGKDVVTVNGKCLQYAEYEYYMLNKPAGVVSATTDSRDKTVIELIKEDKRRDLFPVGRLDKDTEGLLIITNDGVLANRLLSPGKHVDKKYYARVEGRVTGDIICMFKEGLDIGDEKLTAPALLEIKDVYPCGNNSKAGMPCDASGYISEVEITITEGRYHQVKRMFEAVGMKVIYLKRLSMGSLSLDDELECGSYRKLTDKELELLKRDGGM